MSEVTERPRLLYVSPVMPAVAGNGLAMRAGAMLCALAARYRVTLLVAPLYAPRRARAAAEIRACLEREFRAGGETALSPRERFDVVHVYQLAALPFAAPWLQTADRRHLDLADVESLSRRRVADLLARAGEAAAARRETEASRKARTLEDDALARFDRLSVCSDAERLALLGRGDAEIVVLPNTLPLPETTPLPPPVDDPFALLFVGTLGYYPNDDALRFFCAEVLPRIRSEAGRAVTLRIVGAGSGARVRELARQPGVELVGAVADVAPWYRDAHVAIAPIRAGGGTRIKILEAFAQGRPVVTTTIGIEGIAAEDGRHALVRDDPTELAAACLRLLREPALGARLAREAGELFRRAYSHESLAAAVAALDLRRGSSSREVEESRSGALYVRGHEHAAVARRRAGCRARHGPCA